MSNPYFRFKQFTVFQDQCAMKVGTDGVLLGAWVNVKDTHTILDIGTGTGLIALMLAQRSQAVIDGVEIDENACQQARENVMRSPWVNRIQVYHTSIQKYSLTCPKRYDLIVCNPPFFTNVSKAKTSARTLARHSDTLEKLELLQIAQTLLTPTGRLALIYPTETMQELLTQSLDYHLTCTRKLNIKPTPESPIKRVLVEWSKTGLPEPESTVIIETTRYLYSPEFIHLIKDFYLKY